MTTIHTDPTVTWHPPAHLGAVSYNHARRDLRPSPPAAPARREAPNRHPAALAACRAVFGDTYEPGNEAFSCPFDAFGIRVEQTVGDLTDWQYEVIYAEYAAAGSPRGHRYEDLSFGDAGAFTVFVNDVPMGSHDTLEEANAAAAALAAYGERHRVDTARLS